MTIAVNKIREFVDNKEKFDNIVSNIIGKVQLKRVTVNINEKNPTADQFYSFGSGVALEYEIKEPLSDDETKIFNILYSVETFIQNRVMGMSCGVVDKVWFMNNLVEILESNAKIINGVMK